MPKVAGELSCPNCGHRQTKVLEMRGTVNGSRIRRRRACLVCGCRYTTYESRPTDRLTRAEKAIGEAIVVLNAAIRRGAS